jgi:hypothetical protein
MIKTACEQFFRLKSQGKSIKYIQCDDGGKNRELMNQLQGPEWKIPVQAYSAAKSFSRSWI